MLVQCQYPVYIIRITNDAGVNAKPMHYAPTNQRPTTYFQQPTSQHGMDSPLYAINTSGQRPHDVTREHFQPLSQYCNANFSNSISETSSLQLDVTDTV